MKKIKAVALVGLFALLAGVTILPASAYSTAYPSVGGTWQYGKSGSSVISNYYHPSQYHSASIKDASGRLYGFYNAPRGSWARVSISNANAGGMNFYYSIGYR